MPRLCTSNVDRSNKRKWLYTKKKQTNKKQTIPCTNYYGRRLCIGLLANTPTQVSFLLHSLEQAAGAIGLHMNADKTEYICFNQEGDISILNGGSLDKFTHLGSSVSSTESNINKRLAKAYTSIDRKSDLSDKIKRNFFQAVGVSILLFGCITWMLTKRIEKNLDGNCTRMLRAILNKSWKQHPTKQQLYVTKLSSQKPPKLDEQNMRDTAGEVRRTHK